MKVELKLLLPLKIMAEGEYSKDYEELDVSFSTEDVKMSINKFLEMLEGLKDSDVLNAMLLKSEDGKW